MTRIFTLFLATISVLSFAQETDYYTKKNAVINGYDVISYFDGTPKKGSKKLSATYDGATFLFTSQEHLDTFNENPEKYVPQYGGYCAYAISERKIKMQVDPETYEIRDGKLYLFYNSWGTNTLKKWKKTPETLQEKGDTNWETLQFKDH